MNLNHYAEGISTGNTRSQDSKDSFSSVPGSLTNLIKSGRDNQKSTRTSRPLHSKIGVFESARYSLQDSKPLELQEFKAYL